MIETDIARWITVALLTLGALMAIGYGHKRPEKRWLMIAHLCWSVFNLAFYVAVFGARAGWWLPAAGALTTWATWARTLIAFVFVVQMLLFIAERGNGRRE